MQEKMLSPVTVTRCISVLIPSPGLAYRWIPATGLNNPNIANPTATPSVTTTYILETSNSGGGCLDTDTVIVHASVIDNTMRLIGKCCLLHR